MCSSLTISDLHLAVVLGPTSNLCSRLLLLSSCGQAQRAATLGLTDSFFTQLLVWEVQHLLDEVKNNYRKSLT